MQHLEIPKVRPRSRFPVRLYKIGRVKGGREGGAQEMNGAGAELAFCHPIFP